MCVCHGVSNIIKLVLVDHSNPLIIKFSITAVVTHVQQHQCPENVKLLLVHMNSNLLLLTFSCPHDYPGHCT